MQQPGWIDAVLAMPWIAWSVGGLLIALGVFLLWLFLFSDRARGRRRCPECWYDLRGTPGLRCPECGYAARRERAFYRTRRRWRAASGAMLLVLVGTSVALIPKVRQDGWPSIVPTSVLLSLAPAENVREIIARAPGSNWVTRELMRRDAALSMEWWQWRYVLLEKGAIRYRATWPADQALVVEFSPPNWAQGAQISLRHDGGKSGTDLGLLWKERRAFPGMARTGHPSFTGMVDVNRLVKMPALTRRMTGLRIRGADDVQRFGPIELPMRFVPTIEQAMARLAGPEIDQEIRKRTQIQIFRMMGNYAAASDGVFVALALDRSESPLLKDLAVGFTAVFRRAGREIFIEFDPAQIDAAFAICRTWQNLGVFQSVATTDRIRLDEIIDDEPRWEIELRGNPRLALRDWERNSYWDGKLNFTTDDLWVEGHNAESQRRRGE